MYDTHYRSIARKLTWTLFAAQCFGSAGFLAAATVNSIVGAKLTGSDTWATMPTAVYQLGTSLAAFGWGYGMDRLGRRGGLALGIGLGALGALGVTWSVISQSLVMFLVGLVFMGIAQSALQLARFAAAEVHPAAEPLQGALADKINIHASFIVALICFLYLAWHAWKTKSVLKAQGIDHDAEVSSGGH